ncbi:MAG: hypothetical protein ABI613_09875 [Gemmatimonadota bacterium]
MAMLEDKRVTVNGERYAVYGPERADHIATRHTALVEKAIADMGSAL